MKLRILKTSRATTYYVAESYRKENGRVSTRTIERLGTQEDLAKKLPAGTDVEKWCRDYVAKLNAQKKSGTKKPAGKSFRKSTKRYLKGEERIFNGGYLVIQKLMRKLGFDMMMRDVFSKASYQDKEELINALCRCVCEKALAYGADRPSSPLLYDDETYSGGSIPGSLPRSLLLAAEISSAFTDVILKNNKSDLKGLSIDTLTYEYPEKYLDPTDITLYRDINGLPLTCVTDLRTETMDSVSEKLIGYYNENGLRFFSVKDENKNREKADANSSLIVVNVASLQKKLRKWAIDPDEQWSSGTKEKTTIPPYSSDNGGVIYHSRAIDPVEGKGDTITAVFMPHVRENLLNAYRADDSREKNKEIRYFGFSAGITRAISGLSETIVTTLLQNHEGSRELYETDNNLCPLCSKISAAYTSSEKMLFNALTGYMADLILSLITLRTSKILGNTVSRYDISKALRLMEVTKVGNCVSGIFKRDELTDAISDYAGIYLDGELIPQAELEAFLKIS